MKTVYMTKGVCSTAIELEVEDGIVKHVNFVGGCRGNTQLSQALRQIAESANA